MEIYHREVSEQQWIHDHWLSLGQWLRYRKGEILHRKSVLCYIMKIQVEKYQPFLSKMAEPETTKLADGLTLPAKQVNRYLMTFVTLLLLLLRVTARHCMSHWEPTLHSRPHLLVEQIGLDIS